MPTKYFLNSHKTQSMTATSCGCLSKFTILFRVILYTTNIFRVIFCPLAPDPGDVTVYVIHLLVLGILPVWSKYVYLTAEANKSTVTPTVWSWRYNYTTLNFLFK